MTLSRTAKYYASNPKAKAKKKAYDTAYHSTAKRRRYRMELARIRRKKGIMGKSGKDVSHVKGGGHKLESPRTNRARNGANGKSTKAAKRK